MNWISEKNKKIYSDAMGALFEDVKTISVNLATKTGEVVSTGYEKIKETVNHLDKQYYSTNNNQNNNQNHSDSSDSDNNSDDNKFETSEDTDNDLLKLGRIYPDVLIKINKKAKYISRIWIVDNDELKLLRGKISSYPYINNIIQSWFEYENFSGTWKWYVTNKLYTKYRETTPRQLNRMDKIVFRFGRHGYDPYPYFDHNSIHNSTHNSTHNKTVDKDHDKTVDEDRNSSSI